MKFKVTRTYEVELPDRGTPAYTYMKHQCSRDFLGTEHGVALMDEDSWDNTLAQWLTYECDAGNRLDKVSETDCEVFCTDAS